MIQEQEVVSREAIDAELNRLLGQMRTKRQPNKRGVMLLTQFIAGLMFQYGSLDQQRMDAAELVFWLTHNGDGTLIIPQVKSV
jgi:hypothetical protein